MSVLVTGGSGCLGHHLLGTFTHVKGDLISLSLQPPRPYRVFKATHKNPLGKPS